MKHKTIFGAILFSILISITLSYAIITPLQNRQDQHTQETSPNRTETKVNFEVANYRFSLDGVLSGYDAVTGAGASYVDVYIDQAVDNFTIVYRYTCINGTEITKSIDYGTIIPIRGLGTVIWPETVPVLRFGIPNDIIIASSTIIPRNETTDTHWGIVPRVEFMDIYGYA